MKKKLLLISTLIATQLFAKTIDFETMEANPNRISPNSSNEILSFNNSIKDSVHSIVNISAKDMLKKVLRIFLYKCLMIHFSKDFW